MSALPSQAAQAAPVNVMQARGLVKRYGHVTARITRIPVISTW